MPTLVPVHTVGLETLEKAADGRASILLEQELLRAI